MMFPSKPFRLVILFSVICLFAIPGLSAQNTAETEIGDEEMFEELDDMFADPFSDESDEGLSEDMLLDPFADDTPDDSIAGVDFGEDDEIISGLDFDDMFAKDMVEELDTENQDTAPQDDLLVQEEGLKWGGSITGALGADWSWDTLATADYDFTDPQGQNLLPELEGSLFFDARPNPDFRVFGKFKLIISEDATAGVTGLETVGVGAVDDTSLPEGWTSTVNADGETEIRNEGGILITTEAPTEDTGSTDDSEEETGEDEPSTGTPPALELNVFELFSDFSWNDRLFFRFGKHTIKWGTGYFWSPADVLNLTGIDVEDPTADREGPISLKVHFPFSYHNAYLYLISNLDTEPIEIAIAPKAEFVIGNTELGIGGYYQYALAPRLIATIATTIEDFDFFGEGVVMYGSDRVYVRESRDQSAADDDEDDEFEVVLDTYTIDTLPVFQATLGTRYLRTFTEDRGSIAVIGQYFFNGEGYADSTLLEPAYYLFVNPNTNGLMVEDEENQPEGYKDPPALGFSDLTNFGRHYGALTINWEIFDTNLTLTLLGLANFNDLSGIFVPALSWKPFDYCTIGVNARLTFGNPGDEYTNPSALMPGTDEKLGSTITLGVNLSLGSGKF